MSNLLLSTLAMMGLTFIIGFFVAAVIKIIANWADFLDYYRLHRAEIILLRGGVKAEKSESATPEILFVGVQRLCNDVCRKLAHKMSEVVHNLKPHKRIAA